MMLKNGKELFSMPGKMNVDNAEKPSCWNVGPASGNLRTGLLLKNRLCKETKNKQALQRRNLE